MCAFIVYRYWLENNKTILPGIEVASGSPEDGDRSLQVAIMNFGYTVEYAHGLQSIFGKYCGGRDGIGGGGEK